MPTDPFTERTFQALGTLLLAPPYQTLPEGSWFARELEYVCSLDPEQFRGLLHRAETQRVLRRTLEVVQANIPATPKEAPIATILESALMTEKERLARALSVLNDIVSSFERAGHFITIMKTLDHWPDTGSDLDLLVAAEDHEVCRIFEKEFQAEQQPQSWGDKLAHKFNFRIPGLGELVEVHVNCLGQTGEHVNLAAGVLSRRTKVTYDKYSLPVPAPEDRILIATLQRMYRHFYIRLTDIVNIYNSMTRRLVDYRQLQSTAEAASIWEGVATLLAVVQQYGVHYGGNPIHLPDNVRSAAQFAANKTYLGDNFVRVPIVPQAANLYLKQVAGNGAKHNVRAMMRLTLLPMLATAAFVSFRLTGNDKGVW